MHFMVACNICQKGVHTISYSRHKKGSSGAGGTWALRAPIHKKLQRPNLHSYQGLKLCTKCLRTLKSQISPKLEKVETPAASI